MVDKESMAYEKGLRDGFVLTKKDGVFLNELLEDTITPVMPNYPVKRDELLYKSMWLFMSGEEEISLTFIDDNNEEHTISVKSYSKDKMKYRARDLFGIITYYDKNNDNYTSRMLDSKTGYIYIANESYNFIKGALAYIPGKSSYLYNLIDSKISDLKDKGMERLIIDIRNNNGGFETEAAEIASFFIDESYDISLTGKYKSNLFDKTGIYGNGKYKDIPVIVIVNSNTVSAGDGLVYLLSKCDNVKIAGLTNSNNSFQSVGGLIVMSDGVSLIVYPTYSSLDMQGNIFIDTDYTGEATLDIDYKIPITKESISDITYSKDDYVLNYVLKNM